MTTINNYTEQIRDICNYAQKIGFNAETGDYDKLMQDWMEYGRKRHNAIVDNKERAIKILRSIH